jgi:hypothetical protein
MLCRTLLDLRAYVMSLLSLNISYAVFIVLKNEQSLRTAPDARATLSTIRTSLSSLYYVMILPRGYQCAHQTGLRLPVRS